MRAEHDAVMARTSDLGDKSYALLYNLRLVMTPIQLKGVRAANAMPRGRAQTDRCAVADCGQVHRTALAGLARANAQPRSASNAPAVGPCWRWHGVGQDATSGSIDDAGSTAVSINTHASAMCSAR